MFRTVILSIVFASASLIVTAVERPTARPMSYPAQLHLIGKLEKRPIPGDPMKDAYQWWVTVKLKNGDTRSHLLMFGGNKTMELDARNLKGQMVIILGNQAISGVKVSTLMLKAIADRIHRHKLSPYVPMPLYRR